MRAYIECVESLKRQVRQQGWSGMGVMIVNNTTRLSFYWVLALIIVVGGVITAWYEDFPGGVVKPNVVYIFETAVHVEFHLEIAHSYYPPYAFRLQGLRAVGCAVRVGRAFLVAATVEP